MAQIQNIHLFPLAPQITRRGGSIGASNVTWVVSAEGQSDVMETRGVVVFEAGQTEAGLLLRVKGDSIPELEETFLIQLVNISKVGLSDIQLFSP